MFLKKIDFREIIFKISLVLRLGMIIFACILGGEFLGLSADTIALLVVIATVISGFFMLIRHDSKLEKQEKKSKTKPQE